MAGSSSRFRRSSAAAFVISRTLISSCCDRQVPERQPSWCGMGVSASASPEATLTRLSQHTPLALVPHAGEPLPSQYTHTLHRLSSAVDGSDLVLRHSSAQSRMAEGWSSLWKSTTSPCISTSWTAPGSKSFCLQVLAASEATTAPRATGAPAPRPLSPPAAAAEDANSCSCFSCALAAPAATSDHPSIIPRNVGGPPLWRDTIAAVYITSNATAPTATALEYDEICIRPPAPPPGAPICLAAPLADSNTAPRAPAFAFSVRCREELSISPCARTAARALPLSSCSSSDATRRPPSLSLAPTRSVRSA